MIAVLVIRILSRFSRPVAIGDSSENSNSPPDSVFIAACNVREIDCIVKFSCNKELVVG